MHHPGCRTHCKNGHCSASAEQSGAVVLYSEDLNDGQQIAGVRVHSPLR